MGEDVRPCFECVGLCYGEGENGGRMMREVRRSRIARWRERMW